MAKNVHQESVRTGAGIEFHPPPVFRSGDGAPAMGMYLGQSASPSRIGSDRLVALRNEVPMMRSLIVGHKAHCGHLSITQTMLQRLRPGVIQGTLSQFLPEKGSEVHFLCRLEDPRPCIPRPQCSEQTSNMLVSAWKRRNRVELPSFRSFGQKNTPLIYSS